MADNKFIEIINRRIYQNETYHIYLVAKKNLTKKDEENYKKILGYRADIAFRELQKLDPNMNPNVIQVKGSDIWEYVFEHGYVPLFDERFDENHKLTLIHNKYFSKLKLEAESGAGD